MDWVHCNACGIEPSDMKRPKFCLVNCKHVLCEACGTKVASSRQCSICRRGPVKVVPINSKMDKRLQRLFMTPEKLVEEMDKKLGAMRSFEKHQVLLLTEMLGKMQSAFKKTKTACKTQLEMEKQTRRALDSELQKVKSEFDDFRKLVEREKTMATPRVACDAYLTPNNATDRPCDSAGSTSMSQLGNMSVMSQRSGFHDSLNCSGDLNSSFRLDLDVTHRIDDNSSFRCTTPVLLGGTSVDGNSASSVRSADRAFLNTSFGSDPPAKTKRYSVLREYMNDDNEDDSMNRSTSSSQGGRYTPTVDPFLGSGIQTAPANLSGDGLLHQLSVGGSIPKPTKLASFSSNNSIDKSINNVSNNSSDSLRSGRNFGGFVSKGSIVPRF